MKTELSKRFVFAAAAICFVPIGIPLGIQSHRKESTAGMAISLCVAIGYYLLVMLMLNLQKVYTIHPEYMIWLPVLVCFALRIEVFWSVQRIEKHLLGKFIAHSQRKESIGNHAAIMDDTIRSNYR